MIKKIWDKSGIIVSILCLIHCIGLPLVAIFLPALNISLGSELGFHQTIFFFVAIFGLLAFAIGYRVHKNFKLLMFAVLSISVIGLSVIMEHYFEESITHTINIIGSVAVIAAHIWNIKLQRQTGCESPSCHLDHDHPPQE